MPPNPAELITQRLQEQLRPGEAVENGPGGSLYLAAQRFFVAKFNPMEQEATVTPFAYEDVSGLKVQTGAPPAGKPPATFVEIGLTERPATGLGDEDEAAYSRRANVIYCGRGAEAEQMAVAIVQTIRERREAALTPPPPPPPPPQPAVPADWYPDPKGEKRLRYWDGSAWTDHVAD